MKYEISIGRNQFVKIKFQKNKSSDPFITFLRDHKCIYKIDKETTQSLYLMISFEDLVTNRYMAVRDATEYYFKLWNKYLEKRNE
jgi:hypothetical protein